jgi:uncharacterized protein (TIGR00369 family)
MSTTEAEYRAFWEEHRLNGVEPPLHRALGIELGQLSPTTTTITMTMGDEWRGGAPGSIHGGILATFADIGQAISLWNAFDAGSQVPVTTDMHVRYYRQPHAGPLTAQSTVVHRGRRLLGTESVVTDAEARVLARSTATYMVVPFGG